MDSNRLQRQVNFVLEIDRLKGILRRTHVPGTERRENSAEHSWHLAVMALVLAEHSNEEIDSFRAAKMALIHDLVEIDAGDTYCYDEAGNRDREERERKAADRVFGLLPDDQARELRELWEEFEARATPEARFAAALDRLLPVLHNCFTEGKSWREHGVTRSMVIARNRPMREGSRSLWRFAEGLIEAAVGKGHLAAG